jgi:DNA-binding response OmpR family regulator
VRKRIQILVVDDEEMVRRSMKMLLEHDGHEVCLADSGEAALEILAQRKFELVITDFSMPGMHGDQLVVRIRQLIPNQPIIMASAFVEEYKIFGEASGQVDALLLKPFGMKELRAAIEQVLIQAPPEQTSDLPPMAESLPAPDITTSPGTPR